MTQIDLILDQAKQNAQVGVSGILQGNANIQFVVSLAERGNPDTVDNTTSNTDFFIPHGFHDEDSRYDIPETILAPDVPATITHNLGHRYVHVVVTDTAGAPVDVAVVYTDANSLTITANTAVTVTGVVSI